MSKAGKITAAISVAFLLLIVVAIILIATFDWNRLKPTINQKVSAELNRPFAIRGDLGVVWERQKQETGWRSWVPWPHVHAEDIILGNPPDIPEVTMVHLPRVEATLAPLALLTKTVWLPWIKLEKPDARLIRLSEKNNNWTFNLAGDKQPDSNAQPSSWSFRLDNILFDQGRIAHRRLVDDGDENDEAVFDFDVNGHEILEDDAARGGRVGFNHGRSPCDDAGKRPQAAPPP